MTALPQQRTYATPQESQRAASDPQASVWVNASAGSGKTTVLTARVTRLLLSGVRPEKILCLTYTRAGAAEMTNRITAQFSRWVSCDEASLRTDLEKLQDGPLPAGLVEKARRLFATVLACPGGLRIRTIHSFCQEILSRFPIEAGLPPHFALIDDQDLAALKDEITDSLLREAAQNPNTSLARALNVLIDRLGEATFTKNLQEIVKECAHLQASADQLSQRLRTQLNLEPNDSAAAFRRRALAEIPEADMRQLATWLAEGTPSIQKRAQTLRDVLAASDRLPLCDAYFRLFLKKDGDYLSERTVASANIKKKYPQILDVIGSEAIRLRGFLERIECADIAEMSESVLRFGEIFSQRLAARKRDRAAVDYDDLIRLTQSLLQRDGIAPWILYKLDKGIDHILVDEAQDTSRAQWNIVQALAAEFTSGAGAREDDNRTLFVVGDEKQSIFSFQNADPEAFLSLRTFFAEKFAAAGKELERVPMRTSFRSAPAILQAVDAVFASDRARQGVSEDPVSHIAGRPRERFGRVEVWPLVKDADAETAAQDSWILPTDYEDERDPQAELAQRIATQIKEWLKTSARLPSSDRPIRPGDIMILLRRRGRFADLMVRALKANKIAVTGIDRMHLIRELPVMDLLALIRFVLLPEDDLNLATLLRSPLLGLSEEALMALAAKRGSQTLWQRLSASTDAAAKAAYDWLSARLDEADFITPFAFLAGTLNRPCPANSLSGRRALWARLGEEALDPIEELLNAALTYGLSHTPSLQNFLHWLTEADAEIKRELDNGERRGEGQVRIMTVHASKGLEAPIVFLPDTAAPPRSTDIPKFQWTAPESAGGAPLFLLRKPAFQTAGRLWQSARDKQLEEYRRLLYVALTRAESRLYICGWQPNREMDAEGNAWYPLIREGLTPLHQPDVLTDATAQPDIAFADPALDKPAATPTPTLSTSPITLPAWAQRAVPALELPVRPLPPSADFDDSAAATPDIAFARGRIIHRLLQSLPDLAPAKRAAAIDRYLAQPRHALTPDNRAEIKIEVERLLSDPQFAALFGPDSRAEVGLAGRLQGVDVYRQVDRLCLRGGEVWIVDYKTNRPPPADLSGIPDSYRRQLAEYRALLAATYTGHKVRCFLLWTYAPRLMEIPEKF